MQTWEEDGRSYLLDEREHLQREIRRMSRSSEYHDLFLREVFECALRELDEQLKPELTD